MDKKSKIVLTVTLLSIILVVFALLMSGCGSCGRGWSENLKENENGISTETETVHVHTYGEWVIVEDSSCLKEGLKNRICVCGARDEVGIEKKEHIKGNWQEISAPTCITEGEENIKCAVCDTVLEIRTIEKLLHSYTKWTTSKVATCTEAGEEKRNCSVCDNTETRDIGKRDHTESGWIITLSPTCITEGEKITKCMVCKIEINKSIIENTTHDYNTWVVILPPTCTQTGSEKTICKHCNEFKTRDIQAIGHTEVLDNAILPTKYSVGKTEGKHCETCNVVLVEQQDIEYAGLEIKTYDGYADMETHLYKEVNNNIDTYDFSNDFSFFSSKLTWNIYTDNACTNKINPLPLSVGENILYLGVKSTISEESATYKVIVKRLDMKEYFFMNESEIADRGNIQENSNLEITTPIRKTGYSFLYWSLTENGDEVVFPYKITQNTIFYAVFSPITYTVSFNPNGGSVCENMQYVYDDTFTLPQPKREGFTFIGWYYNDEKLENNTWNIPNDCTLLALWQAKEVEYFVKHLLQNIDNDDYDIEYITERFTAMNETYVSPETKNIKGFTSPQQVSLQVKENTELIYTYDRESFDIVFNVNGNTVDTKTLKYETLLQPYYIDGYIFKGWYKGETKITAATENVTLYAKVQQINSINDFEFTITDTVKITKYKGTKDTVVIPLKINNKEVTVIGDNAFSRNTVIKSITITDNITVIGNSAFYYCSNLTSITLGKGVTDIGNFAFAQCNKVSGIQVDDENTSYIANGNCLINIKNKKLILGCNNSFIPTDGSVEIIGNNAFSSLSSLTSITIPDTVTVIEDFAFSSCSNLSSITLSVNLLKIGNSAFSSCKLSSLSLPKSLSYLGSNILYSCPISSLSFSGPLSLWNSISKSPSWNAGIPISSPSCSDN